MDIATERDGATKARIDRARELARELQTRAGELQTSVERRQQAELERLLQSPSDKATLVQMTDQAFRSRLPAREVDQLIHILDVQGVPRFFSRLEQTLLRGFQSFGEYLPTVAAPLVKERMQRETANVVLPAEPEVLGRHLKERHAHGVRMNVNFLGESVLSEAEAERRLERYLEALQDVDAGCFSVKISTLYSQISPLAREHTLGILCERLEALYRSAAQSVFEDVDGRERPKFIYLDMEEYRDMSLTAEAFMRTLERPGLEELPAGIALQAYLPDSHAVQRQISDWAARRRRAGGAPVTIRIVKGANMEMERVDAAQHGWPQAPFRRKAETDSNFKRMLHEGMRHLDAVHLGIASHNLFDVAYGLELAREAEAGDRVQFEMLEGMANHQRRALCEQSDRVLLYAPVCRQEEFIFAIGYLIRRLDENTGPENFLRHAFRLTPDSDDWRELERGFVESFALIPELSSEPRRQQDRSLPPDKPTSPGADWMQFDNEPDTDWSLPANAAWGSGIIDDWSQRSGEAAATIPLVVAGEAITDASGRSWRECLDPSRPGTVVGRYLAARTSDADRAVACAAEDPDGWRALSAMDRQDLLRKAALELRTSRADLMGAAMADAGKTLSESDPEVSEAIDFLEFYAANARWWQERAGDSLRVTGKGVVAVVTPWNFPIAIPCGGVAAALAAGNTVILKPASDAVLPAWALCECFWRAGVSRRALQLLPCSGDAARRLVNHPQVDAVILTGGTETAQKILRERPDLALSAETGGKNATIVTALSDRDLAIKHVLHSAFSHSGQKCSATSLLLLEAEVYDDPEFKRALVEAAESLEVGPAWNPATRVNALIRPPAGELLDALQTLAAGESWALRPHPVAGNPQLWTPGIKWGVQPGSDGHLTEFFGPVLSVMRYERLAEAIDLVNATGYGLTSGLESLDDREQTEWLEHVDAGNLYINRTTVGAIVLRQPFGGFGKSAFGPGLKAGGPNYVAQFMHFEEGGAPELEKNLDNPYLADLDERLAGLPADAGLSDDERRRIRAALASQDREYRAEFKRTHDHFRLPGQDNLRRYRPLAHLRIRVHPDDSAFEIFVRVAAARAVKSRPVVSTPPGFDSPVLQLLHDLTENWAAGIEFVEESDEALAEELRAGRIDRIRYAAADRAPSSVREAAVDAFVYLADTPLLMDGRIELLWYLREQSISHDYHRYGNLGSRSGETRREPA